MGSIQSRKMAVNFLTVGQRPGCRTCQHGQPVYVDRMPPYDNAGMECKRYGFKVTAMAICSQHQPKAKN